MKIVFSEEELTDLLHAWAAISFAFAVLLGGGLAGLGAGFGRNLIVSGLTVGIAFLLHEIGHKALAQKYGCWAEFRKFSFGLILAVAMSFFGFIFAAPGAVMIQGVISREENGKISAAGPLINIFLALIFFAAGIALFLWSAAPSQLLSQIISYGIFINAWLAAFNMIPFPPFDGSKIMAWSMPAWVALTAIAGGMVLFTVSLF